MAITLRPQPSGKPVLLPKASPRSPWMRKLCQVVHPCLDEALAEADLKGGCFHRLTRETVEGFDKIKKHASAREVTGLRCLDAGHDHEENVRCFPLW